jgi:hypothetical protein
LLVLSYSQKSNFSTLDASAKLAYGAAFRLLFAALARVPGLPADQLLIALVKTFLTGANALFPHNVGCRFCSFCCCCCYRLIFEEFAPSSYLLESQSNTAFLSSLVGELALMTPFLAEHHYAHLVRFSSSFFFFLFMKFHISLLFLFYRFLYRGLTFIEPHSDRKHAVQSATTFAVPQSAVWMLCLPLPRDQIEQCEEAERPGRAGECRRWQGGSRGYAWMRGENELCFG